MYCRHLGYCGHAGIAGTASTPSIVHVLQALQVLQTHHRYCRHRRYCRKARYRAMPPETARLDLFGAISDQLPWSLWPLCGSVCLNQLGHFFQPLPLVGSTSLYDKVLVCTMTITYSSVLQSISVYYPVLVWTTKYCSVVQSTNLYY